MVLLYRKIKKMEFGGKGVYILNSNINEEFMKSWFF